MVSAKKAVKRSSVPAMTSLSRPLAITRSAHDINDAHLIGVPDESTALAGSDAMANAFAIKTHLRIVINPSNPFPD
jgi:hypothetical protein